MKGGSNTLSQILDLVETISAAEKQELIMILLRDSWDNPVDLSADLGGALSVSPGHHQLMNFNAFVDVLLSTTVPPVLSDDFARNYYLLSQASSVISSYFQLDGYTLSGEDEVLFDRIEKKLQTMVGKESAIKFKWPFQSSEYDSQAATNVKQKEKLEKKVPQLIESYTDQIAEKILVDHEAHKERGKVDFKPSARHLKAPNVHLTNFGRKNGQKYIHAYNKLKHELYEKGKKLAG